MNCERCHGRSAVIRYREVADGEVRQQWICEECAGALGFGPAVRSSSQAATTSEPVAQAPAPSPDDAGAETGRGAESPAAGAERACPRCGLTGAEFSETSLFGCPSCYVTFDDDLDLLLKRIHGAVAHRGRVPAGRADAGPDVAARLRRDLDAALRDGEYDRAARIRDRLRQLGRTGEGRPGPPGSEKSR